MTKTGLQFDWNRVRAFVVTAETGSFSAAARVLGQTQSTLGRQVTALEEELGVALVERTGQGITLTPSGADLIEYARAMGAAADQLSLMASGRADALEGSVAISATESTAVYVLPPLVRKLRRLHPSIDVEIVATNASSDLKQREADIAIRNFRPTQPDLFARRLADTHLRLYASEAYLATLGAPITEETLSQAEFIGVEDNRPFMSILETMGIHLTAKSFPFATEHYIVHWALVKQGLGIGVASDTLGDAEPGVRRAMASLPPFPLETWLVSHRELKTNRRIRTVFDFLVAELSATRSEAAP